MDYDGLNRCIHCRDHGIVVADRPIAQVIDVDSEEPEPANRLLSHPPRPLPHSAGEHQHIDAFE